MDRKQFLRRSILFTLAAAGLPRISHAFQDKKKKEDEYKKTIKPAGAGEQVYRTSFNEEKIISVAEVDTRIVVEAAFYTGYSFAADAEAGMRRGRYTLQRVGGAEKVDGYTVTKWKVLPKIEGEDVLKGRFKKTVIIKLRSRRHIIIAFSDTDSMQLDYNNPESSAYDDCFLTTACTAAKGLPDDCRELTTLRRLRDVHMKATAHGTALIEEYYRVAPSIVSQVSICANEQEIWNLVYEDMIAPVVALTEADKLDEAVAHYAEYTGWMKEAFMSKPIC